MNIGANRAQFYLECLHELRQDLEAINSKLLISSDLPEIILPQLFYNEKATMNKLYYEQTISKEDRKVEKMVKAALKERAIT